LDECHPTKGRYLVRSGDACKPETRLRKPYC
jgi:hypothetical protein